VLAGVGVALGRRGYARGVAADEPAVGVRPGRDEIVRRAQSGDRDAFDILVHTTTKHLYGVAMRILRDVHQAEDLVQDSLVDAWRDLRALRDPALFDGWVTRILVRNCYREARRVRSVTQAGSITREENENPIAAIDERDRLEQAFRRLSPDHRIVIVLRHYLDWEPSEIAEALGLAPGTVRSRLHYGLAGLRAALEADARSDRSPWSPR
jgi:RNA polymerase sigma-70 factor (ECF subfamily)